MNNVFTGLFIAIYSTAFEVARRLAPLVTAARGRKRGWDLDKRSTLPRTVGDRAGRRVVWVHAASLGEVKLLCQFLAVLEERTPGDCYIATATSRAGVEYLEKMKRPSICAVGFLPFDTLPLMTRLLRTFAVTRVWLLETEIWPCMLLACVRHGVPVGIANARIEEKSLRAYSRAGWLLRPLFEKLDAVLAQNEAYAVRFRELGVPVERIQVVGNMKDRLTFRRPPAAEQKPLRSSMRLAEKDVVLVAGCFHKGEGGVLRETLDALRAKGRRIKTIVVPRKLDESDSLAVELGDTVLRLTDTAAADPWDLCMVEKLGVLGPLYAIADAAVIGGTYVPVGGHNVWEAAQYCIPVFFGPDYHTQVPGCEKLLAAGTGFCAGNAGALATGLERTLWLEKETFAAAAAEFALEAAESRMTAEALVP